MLITLENGDCGTYLLIAEDGREMLIQTDWDYPGIAATFGWKPCDSGTNGTVGGSTASHMITEATEYLDDHLGDAAEDPGYFD